MLTLPFKLTKDQQDTVDKIVDNIQCGNENILLHGVTGVGKTVIIASIINTLQIPTLILSHNKILAKQLFDEVHSFFGEKYVNYFISHFEHYQAESYLPTIDRYIEKQTVVDHEIDRLRMKATRDIIEQDFSVCVASVSAIFGAGIPLQYINTIHKIKVGDSTTPHELTKILVQNLFYERSVGMLPEKFNEISVIGDQIKLLSFENNTITITIGFDMIESIVIEEKSGNKINVPELNIYPAYHYVGDRSHYPTGIELMKQDLAEQLEVFAKQDKSLEATRLEERTMFDISMIEELGYTRGMENYVKYFYTENLINHRPSCLIDYYKLRFGNRFLTVLDESHLMVGQISGMVNSQRSIKQTLIEHGFRLPSCLMNRPLTLDEFNHLTTHKLFVSATPRQYELSLVTEETHHQLILRPTGITDATIEIRPIQYQIDDILQVLKEQKQRDEQTIIVTLTIKSAESLVDYLLKLGHKAAYIHSGIKPKERIKLFNDIRELKYDVIVGVNTINEGIDLPNASCVCIIDADKEGFLRSESRLTQIGGRANRHPNGRVFLFADRITNSMQRYIDGSTSRRDQQIQHNEMNNIVPVKATNSKTDIISSANKQKQENKVANIKITPRPISYYQKQIKKYVKKYEFELAEEVRQEYEKLYPTSYASFKDEFITFSVK